jgi:hypothetical protein
MNSRVIRFFVLAISSASVAVAAPDTDKSIYHLLRPTPQELMREMSTDRPDTTEAPYTVDAGHFQVEADLFKFTRERHNVAKDHTVTEALELAPFNFKVGLCNYSDLQLVVPTYTSLRTRDRRTRVSETVRGFGDMEVRVKINVWGNDGGEIALALMPYVKLPTGRRGIGNDAVEGGLIVPVAFELPRGWGLGAMAQVDVNEDGDGSGHHLELMNTLALSHDIVGDLAGYVEFISLASADERAKWSGSAGFGLTYALTRDIQLDAGLNVGITRAADDFQPFAGVSWRF